MATFLLYLCIFFSLFSPLHFAFCRSIMFGTLSCLAYGMCSPCVLRAVTGRRTLSMHAHRRLLNWPLEMFPAAAGGAGVIEGIRLILSSCSDRNFTRVRTSLRPSVSGQNVFFMKHRPTVGDGASSGGKRHHANKPMSVSLSCRCSRNPPPSLLNALVKRSRNSHQITAPGMKAAFVWWVILMSS